MYFCVFLSVCASLQNNRWTLILTSQQRLTTASKSMSVEHVADMKRKYTTGEEQQFLGFLSLFLSLPPSLSLLIREKKHHVIIFINNYQKQTPRRNTGLAVAALKQQSCLCGQTHTHRWATAVQQHSLHTLHSQDMCTCLYKLSHCLSAE